LLAANAAHASLQGISAVTEAIEIAKREYKAAVLDEAKRKHQDTAELDALRAEEVLLRKC
jgi:hypothetical protein